MSGPTFGRRKLLGLRLWHWLVLLGLAAANVCLAMIFAPMMFANLQVAALAQPPAPRRADNTAALLTPTPTPLPIPTAIGAGSITPLVIPPSPPPAFVLSAPTPVSDPALPAEARIAGIGGQKQKYSLSCEARAAVDWAAYFGFPIDEDEFLRRLPASDNPDFGFVGDVNGRWGQIPPDAYGVHAGPVAFLLRHYGLNAHAYQGLTWDQLRAQIAAGKPVITWVTGHVGPGIPVAYTASDGRTTTVARFEHTVILIGYTPDTVTLLDGSKIYTRPVQVFLDSWAVLGNMAITRGLIHFSN